MNISGTTLSMKISCNLTKVNGTNHGSCQTRIYVHFLKYSISFMTIEKFKSKDEMQVWCGTCRKNLELFCLAIVVTNRFWCSKLAQNSNQKHPCQLRKISLALVLQSWFCYSVSTGQDLLAWRQCKHHLFAPALFFQYPEIVFTLFALNQELRMLTDNSAAAADSANLAVRQTVVALTWAH